MIGYDITIYNIRLYKKDEPTHLCYHGRLYIQTDRYGRSSTSDSKYILNPKAKYEKKMMIRIILHYEHVLFLSYVLNNIEHASV